MKSIFRAAGCVAVLVFAVPALAATDDTMMHHHHHHMMHGKHGMMMKKGAMSGSAETEKLNEQSLQNAKAGVMPASGSDAGMAPTAPGAPMAAPMAAPGNAMAAPGTGMSSAPASGSMGTVAPGNAPPITTPPAAPASDNK